MLDKSIISDQISQDLQTACAIAKQEGYEYIELHNVFHKSIEECSDEEVEAIKKILTRYQLKVSNIASTIFFLCPLYDHYKVSLFNPEFHAIEGDIEYHLKSLDRACKIANELSCKTIRIFPFRFPDNEDVTIVGTKEDQTKIIEVFKQAVVIAEKYDVILVVENCPYSHCPKGEMTYGIVRAVNHANLKLLWDPANSYRAEVNKVPKEYLKLNLMEEYDLIKEEVRHIHFKNYHFDGREAKPFLHTSLLEGDINFVELMESIRNSYLYALSLEPEVDMENTLKSMNELKRLVG